MTRRTVAVLMGGTSPEHGVSLKSGATMWRGLASAGHRVLPVVVSRDGLWNLLDASVLPEQLPSEAPGAPALPHRRGDALAVTALLKAEAVDIVMIGLHGPGGEDGSIQGFFEVAGIPYTGPGIPCSAVAMDKLWLKRLLKAEGLPTSEWIEFSDDEIRGGDIDALARKAHAWVVSAGDYPVVAKARHLGSSFGVAFVPDAAALHGALATVLAARDGLFIERGIRGTEVSCGVVGHGASAVVLPAVEIVPKNATWFDFASKYQSGGSLERIPAEVPPETESRIRELAGRVHALLDAEGITRTDMIVDEHGPWILETNTLPGMTATSLVPQEAAAIGWSLERLLETMIDIGLARSASRRA